MATLKAVEWWCSECGQAHVRKVKKCGRCKVAFTAEASKPSHNIDYTAALEEEISSYFCDRDFLGVTNSRCHNLALRLNSVVKAQQNCV